MQNIDDILGQLKLPERVYPLCVRADLRAQWEELNRQLRLSRNVDSLAGSGGDRDLATKVAALEAEMAEHTVQIQLRALNSKAWSDLLAKHAPRPDTDDSVFNGETFGAGMLAACSIDPVMDEDQAGRLIDAMTQGQWNDLTTVLWNLNTGSVEVPKSKLASEILQVTKKK